MKYLQLCTIIFLMGNSLVEIRSLPIQVQHQVTTLSPGYINADLTVSTHNPHELTALSFLDVENADKFSAEVTKELQRSTRGFGWGGLGDFGGIGGKFGGLGLGFKGLGGFGNWGFGGIHGLGLGGYKPFFGKYFG